tara:strand:+ start:337 stop:567 length:231 start_codon:yes stop_codon:yes gene_type:complete
MGFDKFITQRVFNAHNAQTFCVLVFAVAVIWCIKDMPNDSNVLPLLLGISFCIAKCLSTWVGAAFRSTHRNFLSVA